MASKTEPKAQNDSSQFRIQENWKKRKVSGSNKNNKYSVISYEKRVQLISLASSKGYSISRAARELGIKPSTGKFIVKCFRDYGKIMKKTNSHLLKNSCNKQQECWNELPTKKVQKNQKECNSSSQEQNHGSNKETVVVQSPANEANELSTYLLACPYNQQMMGQLIFYPNFENIGLITVPFFYPQSLSF